MSRRRTNFLKDVEQASGSIYGEKIKFCLNSSDHFGFVSYQNSLNLRVKGVGRGVSKYFYPIGGDLGGKLLFVS